MCQDFLDMTYGCNIKLNLDQNIFNLSSVGVFFTLIFDGGYKMCFVFSMCCFCKTYKYKILGMNVIFTHTNVWGLTPLYPKEGKTKKEKIRKRKENPRKKK